MLASSGERTAPWGVPVVGSQRAMSDMISCRRKPSISVRTRPSLIVSPTRAISFVTLQVGIHDMREALLQQPIDLPQRIFAASSRPEAVTSRPELDFKDWLNGHLQSRLHDAVLDGRYPERTGLPAALGNIDPFDRARPVAAVLQILMKLRQIPFRTHRKPRDALTIHACRPLVPLDFPPRGFQGCRPDGLIHHAKPLAS